MKESAEEVVAISIKQKGKKQNKTYLIGFEYRLIAHPSASYNLPKSEEDIPTIQHRDREEVHKSKNHRKKGCNTPKAIGVEKIVK